MKIEKPLTYISLFSSAWIGCYGFQLEDFSCVATVEILEKRLNIQKLNHKCKYDSWYISDDITMEVSKNKIRSELERWNISKTWNDLDVLIATPPCQGMSVANHKKGNELNRNSLVIESILLTKEILPKFFIFENVRAFLKSECLDADGKDKTIKEAIESSLGWLYHITYQVINFKDYGNPSSRTRTLVIGTRKNLIEATPFDIFPSLVPERTLKEVIWHLPALETMGTSLSDDIYHNFKKYPSRMRTWIDSIKEWESAFNNIDPNKIPHKVVDEKIIFNVNKNGDKYKRQYWSKAAPCVHTRNDILSSQNTVHPVDDRVFSIREVMLMMSVPGSFNWTSVPLKVLNELNPEDKAIFLSKEEMNIRHCLWEAVPTIIFHQIAQKIKTFLFSKKYSDQSIKKIIDTYTLQDISSLQSYLSENLETYDYPTLSKIAELANTTRTEKSAYYTRQDICYSVVKDLPEINSKIVKILEPSIGVGNFLPLLIAKYRHIEKVIIDVVDIDENALNTLKILLQKLNVPKNIVINFIHADFLTHSFTEKYDIVVGNPPFKKVINDKKTLAIYKKYICNIDTNNLFAFFIEKALQLGKTVAFIVPKSLIGTPEFNKTRDLLEKIEIQKITDYGESAFKGVKIETISFIANSSKKPHKNKIEIESYIKNTIIFHEQSYIFSKDFPYWLIYRNDFFDTISNKMNYNIFKAYRDRQITKKITTSNGVYRVLKSRNIGSNKIVDIDWYDSYTNETWSLDVGRFLDEPLAVLVPNLTYAPRACFLPTNTIVDWSVAILTPKDNSIQITKKDLEYFGTTEYHQLYAIARNFGTRSLNIDNNSVFFFGLLTP